MAVRTILQHPDDRLRVKCKRVNKLDSRLQQLIDDMVETMKDGNGLGLAAPQIGIPLRITTIQLPDDYDDPRANELLILINPEIIKSAGEWSPDEGCLSIPGYVANVKRFWTVTVKAVDRKGRDTRLKADGLLGQALQHEIDHLNGILFIDHLESLDQLRRSESETSSKTEAMKA